MSFFLAKGILFFGHMSEAKEKAAGQKAARSIRTRLQKETNTLFERRTGRLQKTSVAAKTKFGQLDRITITTPRYSFMHHFGYTRKYGSRPITVPAKEHIGKAIDKSNALDRLADELGAIRVDEITAKIRF